jgi:sporulation protein YlmC with PRC-barrel domain
MKQVFKSSKLAFALAPFLAMSLTLPAQAGDAPTRERTAQKQTAPTSDGRFVRASKLIGKDVRNAQGEDLGDIKDVIVDINNSRVHYVVLEFGGFLGMGEKHFAYPMRVFKASADKDELVLNVDKERLKKAPGFDKDKSPDWNDPDYRGRVDKYFGNTVVVKPQPNMRLVRGSDLIGKNVDDANGKDVGEIEDIVVNLGTGNIHYAVLEFDKAWSLGDKRYVFPMKSFRTGAKTGDDLVLNVTREQVDRMPGFDANKWPDLNDSRWNREIDSNFSNSRPRPTAG